MAVSSVLAVSSHRGLETGMFQCHSETKELRDPSKILNNVAKYYAHIC